MFKGTKPFIHTCKGFILYSSSLSIMLASYISLADRSHTLFGNGSTAGLTVGSEAILFPNGNVIKPGVTILVVCILTAYFAYLLNQRFKNRRYIVTSVLIIYGILLVIGIKFPGNYITMIERPLFSLPLIVSLTYTYQSFAIIFLSYVFSTPLYQTSMSNDDRVFLDNQWRYTQAFLSTILVGVVGVTLPFSMEVSEYFRIIGLLSTLGFLMAIPVAVIIFMLFRINEIEKNIG